MDKDEERILTVDTKTGEVVSDQTEGDAARDSLLVYGWLFALAVGRSDLRAAAGLELAKLALAYAGIGLFCAALGIAIIKAGRGKTGKPDRMRQVLLLLGITAAVLFLGK